MRTFLKILLSFLAPVNYVFSFFRSDRRSLVDLASGTKVIGITLHDKKKKRFIVGILLAIYCLFYLGAIGYAIFNYKKFMNNPNTTISKSTSVEYTVTSQLKINTPATTPVPSVTPIVEPTIAPPVVPSPIPAPTP